MCELRCPVGAGHDVLTLDVPLLVKNEVEGREGEFLLQQGGKLFLDGSRPTTDQDNELVDDPGNSSARRSVVVAREMLTFPDFLVKLWINNERHHLTSCRLHTTRRQLFFMDAEERMRFRVVPEDADAGGYGAVIHHYGCRA